MIEAVDAQTLAPVRMNHPDEERDTKVRNSNGSLTKLWERHTDVYVGKNRFKHVFKSVSLQKLVWHYPKEKLWVVLHNYDEELEDNDGAYAQTVDDYMSSPASDYQVDKTKEVIDTTDQSKKRGARPKRKKIDDDESFDAPFKVNDDDDMKTDEKEKVVVPASMMAAAAGSAPADNKASTPVDSSTSAPVDSSTSAPADSSTSAPADSSASAPADSSASAPAGGSSSAPAGGTSSASDAAALEKQKLEDALKLAQEELLKKTAEIDSERSRADNFERLHKNYKQREGRKDNKAQHEVILLKQENSRLQQEKAAFDAACQAERDAAQQKFDAQQKRLNQLKAGNKDPSLKNVGVHVDGAYSEIINFVYQAYETKAKAFSSSNVSGAGASAAGADTFSFLDQSNNWVQITDPAVVTGLSMLSAATDRFSYQIGNHDYEARLADGSWIGVCDIVQKNINPQYLTERQIKKVSAAAAAAAAAAPSDGSLTIEQKHDILFGDSPVDFSSAWIDDILQKYAFDDSECYSEASLELAKLAEFFNTFSNNFKYVNGKKHKTDVFIKPVALYNWLTLAKARNYTSMRLVMHGADKNCYKGVREDPFGMDLKYAGMHGQAFGNGFYFGLSDHVTLGYNRVGKPGTALMGLCLTNKNIDNSDYRNHHGGYRTFDSTNQVAYTTFQLSAPKSGTHNCIVVHEGALVLILGEVATL